MSRLLRFAAATTVAAIPTLMLAGHASAHNSGASATCDGITTTLTNFENAAGDRVYTYIDDLVNPVDTFNGPFVTTTHTVPVPQDGVTHAWKVVVDSVSGNGTQYDATYIGQVGPCGSTTSTSTTEAPTTTIAETTTTVEQTTTTAPTTTSEATTTTLESTTTSTIVDTTEPSTTVVETTVPEVTTTVPTTVPTTTVPEGTTTVPVVTTVPAELCADGSVPPCAPPITSTTVPECVDNPATPADDCAPICVPVTLEDGSNSCSPPLPATGSENTVIMVIAVWLCAAGIVALGFGRIARGRGR